MPQYFSPGVYVEEVDAGPKPIEGVSTSMAGVVGVTARGPTRGKPVLVTSFGEFRRIFGGFLPEPDPAIVNQWGAAEGGEWWKFPLAVKGFFDNGGQQLFVKRVFAASADASSRAFGRGLVIELEDDVDDANATEVTVAHLFGIENGTQLRPIVNGQPAGAAVTVASYDGGGHVTLIGAIGTELEAGRDFFELEASRRDNATTSLTVRARAHGVWGDDLRVRIRPMVSATLDLLPDAATGGASLQTSLGLPVTAGADWVSVRSITGLAGGDEVVIGEARHTVSNPTAGFDTTVATAAVAGAGTVEVAGPGLAVGDRVAIGDAFYTVAAVGAGPDSIDVNPVLAANVAVGDEIARPIQFGIAPVAGSEWAAGTPVTRVRAAAAAGTNRVRVTPTISLYENAIVELDDGSNKERFTVDSIDRDTDTVTLSGNLARDYVAGNSIRVLEAAVDVEYLRDGTVEAAENFTNLRLVDDQSRSHLVTHIEEESELIEIELGADYSESNPLQFPVAGAGGLWTNLQGGDDRLGELSVDDFVGVNNGSGNRTGIQALEDVDDISICLAPSMWAGTIRSALIRHCETMRYRMAILDPEPDLDISGIRAFRAPMDTRYAALYYPWLVVRNPSTRRFEPVAPSGHMAGIYARVDTERGYHKAPANEVIRGIRLPSGRPGEPGGIAQDITKREQDLLNPRGINAIRYFPGRGQRVWGARTLSSDQSWKYVNVRRIFNFVEASIDRGTQWVVFEPNDEGTWARVRQTIRNFLLTVWRGGALEGVSEEEAFFVRCDRTTMTQAEIDNGLLICVIGIAPVKPAEFVVFRIQQFTRESA